VLATKNPKPLAGVVLLSSFLGETGPTARWLIDTGLRVLSMIPRDLRHAILEVTGQSTQLVHMQEALRRLNVPVHVIHGDADDFAPIELAQKLVAETRSRQPMRFVCVPGANHFLNDGPAELLLNVLECCVPAARGKAPLFKLPVFPALPPLPNLAWLGRRTQVQPEQIAGV
jgi:pimeloyl-ACP methyl ester carboxylesterase